MVAGLPKTRSGKILRKTMRGIADGLDEPVPSTIDDVAVLDALRPGVPQGVTEPRRSDRTRRWVNLLIQRRVRSVAHGASVGWRRSLSGEIRRVKPLALLR